MLRIDVKSLIQLIILSLVCVLSACAVTPTTVVQGPMTAKPTPVTPVAANSGAIYNASAYRPLFSDRKPSMVGDILTINIVENTSATKATGSSGSKKSATKSSITSFFGHQMPDSAFAGSTDSSNEDKDAANASNVFNGSITVTVIEVLSNGNLLVSGEKQVSLDKGTEFVRLSGVVNPFYITAGNVISSTQVADARVEYRTNAKIDGAQISSMFARFFLSLGAL